MVNIYVYERKLLNSITKISHIEIRVNLICLEKTFYIMFYFSGINMNDF